MLGNGAGLEGKKEEGGLNPSLLALLALGGGMEGAGPATAPPSQLPKTEDLEAYLRAFAAMDGGSLLGTASPPGQQTQAQAQAHLPASPGQGPANNGTPALSPPGGIG